MVSFQLESDAEVSSRSRFKNVIGISLPRCVYIVDFDKNLFYFLRMNIVLGYWTRGTINMLFWQWGNAEVFVMVEGEGEDK